MLWDLIEKSNRLCSLSPRSEPYPKNQKQLVLVLCPWWSCCRIWSSFIHRINETVFRVKTNFGFNPACVNKLTRFRQRVRLPLKIWQEYVALSGNVSWSLKVNSWSCPIATKCGDSGSSLCSVCSWFVSDVKGRSESVHLASSQGNDRRVPGAPLWTPISRAVLTAVLFDGSDGQSLQQTYTPCCLFLFLPSLYSTPSSFGPKSLWKCRFPKPASGEGLQILSFFGRGNLMGASYPMRVIAAPKPPFAKPAVHSLLPENSFQCSWQMKYSARFPNHGSPIRFRTSSDRLSRTGFQRKAQLSQFNHLDSCRILGLMISNLTETTTS